MSSADAKTRLEAIRDEVVALKEEAKRKAQEIFHEESKRLFTDHPCLSSFFWTQYTPYFNDGEACTFSSNHDSFGLILKGVTLSEADFDDREEPYCGPCLEDDEVWFEECGWYINSKHGAESTENKLSQVEGGVNAARAVKEFIEIFDDDDMENMFGDHVVVTVTAEGVDASDYEHE